MNAPVKPKASAAPAETVAVPAAASKAAVAASAPAVAKKAVKPAPAKVPATKAAPVTASPVKRAVPAKALKAVTKIPPKAVLAKPVTPTPIAEKVEVAVKAAPKAVAVEKPKAPASAKAATLAAPVAKRPDESLQSYQDALDLSKVTVDALVQSSTAFARGMQDMSKEVISLTQASIEDTVAASKAMFGVRTIKDLVDLQSSLARRSFDRLMADSGKISEFGVKLAEQTFAPINASISVAVDKLANRAI